MIWFLIVKPSIGGLCYFIAPSPPTFMPAWVPDIKLATLFDTRRDAESIAALLDGAFVEEIEITDE